MASNYDIDYKDERFTQVEADKKQALTEVENTYSGMIDQTDSYYQAQIDASKQWADKQQQLQQENTDFMIEQIEQQKQQANKDYLKEQSGAYADWQKQSNAYGVNAEQMASSGLTNTGFSESSQVSMYNTYQNRVSTARESYNQAVLNYNNSIKEAQLQNNSALAEIAYTAFQQQLELSLQGFQYKNQLITEQANKKLEVDNIYYNRYQDVLNQMNQENALAEEIRQYNQSYELQLKQYQESIRQFDEEMARLKKKDAEEYALQIKQLELQKKQAEEAKAQAAKEYEAKSAQLKKTQEEVLSTNTAKGSGKSSTPSTMEIAGYGKVNKTYETYYVNGKDVPIYATGDGTWWYWNENVGIWIRLAKNANKPTAVKRQEMLNKVTGVNTGVGSISYKSSSALPVNTNYTMGAATNLYK